jgi:hypothetical protein
MRKEHLMTKANDTTTNLAKPFPQTDLTDLITRWRAFRAANSVGLMDAIGMETLEALLAVPITNDAEARGLVEVVGMMLKMLDGCRRADQAEVRLLRRVADYLEAPQHPDFDLPATKLSISIRLSLLRLEILAINARSPTVRSQVLPCRYNKMTVVSHSQVALRLDKP